MRSHKCFLGDLAVFNDILSFSSLLLHCEFFLFNVCSVPNSWNPISSNLHHALESALTFYMCMYVILFYTFFLKSRSKREPKGLLPIYKVHEI